MYHLSRERQVQAYAEMWPAHPRWGMWAWWAQRVSGVGLTAYVVWHIVTVAGAARHPQGFAALLRGLTHPAVYAVLVLGLAYHTANGIRAILLDLGVTGTRGRHAFWAFTGLGALLALAGILRGILHVL